MKYSFSDWNHKSGTLPVHWKDSDYENLKWHLHKKLQSGDITNGYATEKSNIEIYKDQIGLLVPEFSVGDKAVIPKQVDAIFGYIINSFDLSDSIYTFNKYTPGMILPWHTDTYPTYSKNNNANIKQIVRVIVFLHDPAPGQQLWIGEKLCIGQKGTWHSWQGATRHMAANLGETPRYTIQITGKSHGR